MILRGWSTPQFYYRGARVHSAMQSDHAGELVREFGESLYHGFFGKRYLFMLEIYFDDSGTHGGPYCFLAGYLASTQQWAEFAKQWVPLRREYLGDRPFKMSAANREKDPGYIPEEGLVRMAHCIADHVEMEVWSALPEYYAEKIQNRYGVRFDRYRTCFTGVLTDVLQDPRVLSWDEPLTWTFDHQGGTPQNVESELESSLIRAFNHVKSVLSEDYQKLLQSITFADDEFVVPLQAADFLAWHKRRRHADGADIRERPSCEVLRRADTKRIEVIWFDHKLEDLLDKLTRREQP